MPNDSRIASTICNSGCERINTTSGYQIAHNHKLQITNTKCEDCKINDKLGIYYCLDCMEKRSMKLRQKHPSYSLEAKRCQKCGNYVSDIRISVGELDPRFECLTYGNCD